MTQAKSENYPVTFIAGLILGSIMTALITPKKGEELRRTIKDKTDKISSRLKRSAEDQMEEIEEKADKTKKALEE